MNFVKLRSASLPCHSTPSHPTLRYLAQSCSAMPCHIPPDSILPNHTPLYPIPFHLILLQTTILYPIPQSHPVSPPLSFHTSPYTTIHLLPSFPPLPFPLLPYPTPLSRTCSCGAEKASTSFTVGYCCTASSISKGEIVSPPLFMISFDRPEER